jgi:hypothetical protein
VDLRWSQPSRRAEKLGVIGVESVATGSFTAALKAGHS